MLKERKSFKQVKRMGYEHRLDILLDKQFIKQMVFAENILTLSTTTA